MFPDFLCIGAQRAGTTWLYANLKKHPKLWLPPVKEIHYFDRKENDYFPHIWQRLFDEESEFWRKNLKYQIKSNLSNLNSLKSEKILWDLNYFFNPRNDQWYASLFDIAKEKVTGDITPAYSTLNKESVAHIYRIMPNTKIIFILRNPIQRAWSQVLKYINETKNTKVDSVPETELIEYFNTQESRLRGDYLRTLQIWQSHYPQEQFFIGFFEEIKECPEEFLLRIHNFLNVEVSQEYVTKKISKQKINSFRKKEEIPENIAAYLAQIYHDEIKHLHKYLGSSNKYLAAWLK